MIKISQLPDAEKYTGGEVFPVVQDGITKKAPALFTDAELKVHVPENAAIVTSVEGTEINLISAKVIDGVVTVFVGDKEVSLHQDSNIIVTETEKKDGNTYVRINNKWAVRNPITQINGLAAPTGGGKIDVTAKDVKAHVETGKLDGIAYVSRDGGWITLAEGMKIDLDKKADKVHTHVIQDVNGLQTELDKKADKVHTHAIADVTGLSTELSNLQKNIDDKKVAITDVIGLETELETLNTDLNSVITKHDQDMAKKADIVHTHEIDDVTGLKKKLDDLTYTSDTNANQINSIKNQDYMFTLNSAFTGTEETGKLPLTAKAKRGTTLTSDTIKISAGGMYAWTMCINIESDDTVVEAVGLEGMIVSGKGSHTMTGMYQLTAGQTISLVYRGVNSIVSTNTTLHHF